MGVRPALVGALALALSGASTASTRGADGDNVLVDSLGMKMIRVPAGTFVMGSPAGESFRQDEERPHRVTLTRGFRISATEVTQRQWGALMPHDRSPVVGDDLPVTSVSWKDVREFCRRLSEEEGAVYRLPTEAEWECACRSGGPDPLDAPGAVLDTIAWFADNSGDVPHAVGQKQPTPWGLFDLLGNVAEWTLDVYAPYPDADAIEDPTGPGEGAPKVVRGGAFRSFPPALRCAARTGAPESYQLSHVGFRVVREGEP